MEKINENHELLEKSSNCYDGAKNVPVNAAKNQGQRFAAKVIHPKTPNLLIDLVLVLFLALVNHSCLKISIYMLIQDPRPLKKLTPWNNIRTMNLSKLWRSTTERKPFRQVPIQKIALSVKYLRWESPHQNVTQIWEYSNSMSDWILRIPMINCGSYQNESTHIGISTIFRWHLFQSSRWTVSTAEHHLKIASPLLKQYAKTRLPEYLSQNFKHRKQSVAAVQLFLHELSKMVILHIDLSKLLWSNTICI